MYLKNIEYFKFEQMLINVNNIIIKLKKVIIYNNFTRFNNY